MAHMRDMYGRAKASPEAQFPRPKPQSPSLERMTIPIAFGGANEAEIFYFTTNRKAREPMNPQNHRSDDFYRHKRLATSELCHDQVSCKLLQLEPWFPSMIPECG